MEKSAGTRKIAARRKALLLTGALAAVGLCAYLPFLAVPLAPFIAGALAVFFINRSKLFFVLAAAVPALPLSYLGDAAAVIFTALIASAAVGIIAATRVKNKLLAAGLAMLVVMAGITAPTVVYLVADRAASGETQGAGQFVSRYVKENRLRPDVLLLTDLCYALKEETETDPKLPRGADGYRAEADAYFSALANRWADEELFYFLLGQASLTAIAGFLGAYLLRRRFAVKQSEPEPSAPDQSSAPAATDPFDAPLQPPAPNAESAAPPAEKNRAEFVKTEPFTADRLHLGRKYFLFVFLPASLVAFLSFVPALMPVTLAIFNALVVVPCFFAACSLFLYAALKIPKKGARTVVLILLALAGLAAILFPLGMLIFALFGLADALLNVRKLLDYALS